jgi:tetratricopeptide (TPR) repeat protein
MSELPKKILIYDPDQGALQTATRFLDPYKMNILKSQDWESSLYQFHQNRLDLCIVPLRADGLTGLHLIQKWRAHEVSEKRQTAFVVAVSNAQITPGELALIKEMGDITILNKPYQIGPILAALTQAMKVRQTREAIDLVDVEIRDNLKKDETLALGLARTKLEPLGEKGLFRSALIHEEVQKWEHALGLLEKIQGENPQNMLYTNELGLLYLKTGKLDKAKAFFEKADELAPQNLIRVREMAYLYLETKEPDKSVAKFQELVKLNPESKDVAIEASQALFDAGFQKHARDFCAKNTGPKELVRYFNNRGVLLAKENQFPAAITEYQKAIDLIPGHKELHRVYYNMGISSINLKTQEHLEKAQFYLKESLRLSPDYDKAKEKLELVDKYLKK